MLQGYLCQGPTGTSSLQAFSSTSARKSKLTHGIGFLKMLLQGCFKWLEVQPIWHRREEAKQSARVQGSAIFIYM